MILGVSIVGATSFAYPTGTAPLFNRVDIYNGAGYDNLVVLNESMTKAEMEAYFGVNQDYPWTITTRLYAEFISNLFGGNISVANLEKFWLYRLNIRTNEKVLIRDDIEPDANETFDSTAVRNENYRYQLVGIGANDETSNGIWSNDVGSDYYGWFLIDDVEKIAFKFDIDLNSSNLKFNHQNKVYVSPTEEKPVVMRSNANYVSGTVKCKLGYIDESCTLEDGTDYMELFRQTINNGNKKYLKDRKGNVYPIEIIKNTKFSYIDKTQQQVTGIQFDFVEVRDN